MYLRNTIGENRHIMVWQMFNIHGKMSLNNNNRILNELAKKKKKTTIL